MTDRTLSALAEKIEAGERLTFEDGMALSAAEDLLALGRLANRARERRWGDQAFYTINLHINPTNSCFASCRFCAFGRRAFDDKSYIRKPEEIVERARRLLPPGGCEIHLVGGLDPRLKLDYYCAYLRALKSAFPGVHLKTLTPVEVVFIAQVSKCTVREALERLRAAGMDSMPGGGAEIFDPEIRRQLCAHKCDTEAWFEVHRMLHEMGVPSNCTMLYGHIESARHRVDHLLRLRAHQDQWKGFQCFVPLAFHPANTELAHLPGPSAVLDLKTIAVARLLLDNIPHIKAYWISLGLKTAQTALWFGADDIDGTVIHEEVHHDAGADSPRGVDEQRLRELVTEAGRRPVRRDALYHTQESAAPPPASISKTE